MQRVDAEQGLQDVNLQFAEHQNNVSNEWDLTLQEVINPVTTQEKEVENMYYSYGTVVNNLSAHENSWGMNFNSSQIPCFVHNQNEKKKLQEIEQQNLPVSANDTRCGQFGCSATNATNSQGVDSYCSYIHDRQDSESIKQNQNGLFLSECDLAKLSDLAPDIINLENNVNSEFLKVVDTDEEEEEDLVVDDSETESEISVSDAGSYVTTLNGHYEQQCMICSLPRSHTVEANFFHVDNTYPLTFVSKTPVITKLLEILPANMQPRLNLGDNLICRRCFNLIDTAENLELRLITVKQELCEFLARAQATAPVTETNQRNLPSCMAAYNSPGYFVGARVQPSSLHIPPTDFQRHMPPPCTTNCGISDCTYLNNRGSSNIYNSKPIIQNYTGFIQNEDQLCKLIKPCKQLNCPVNTFGQPNLISNCYSQSEELAAIETSLSESVEIGRLSSTGLTKSETEVSLPNKQQNDLEKNNLVKTSVVQNDKQSSENLPNEEDTKENSISDKVAKFQCDRCGKTFSHKFSLVNHLKKHSGDFRFKCQHCTKGYMMEMNLILHLRSHTNIRPHLCNTCPASFISVDELHKHRLLCTNKMHSCKKCIKLFSTPQKLDQHIQSRHNKTDVTSKAEKPKKHKCEICSKRFRFPNELEHHSRSHNNIKSHSCKICGRSYKHKRHLNRHHRDFHLNPADKSEIIKHRRTPQDNHLEIAASAYFEDECTKVKSTRNLEEVDSKNGGKDHQQSLEKPTRTKKICPICKKAVWKLNTHMVSHSSVKRYRCDICNVEFTLKQGLVRHFRNKHANEKIPDEEQVKENVYN